MSIVTLIIIIGIITSVINALQPKNRAMSSSRRTMSFPKMLSIREETPPPMQKRTIIGTHERLRRGEEGPPVRFLPPESSMIKRIAEDKKMDFGDPETVYAPIESQEIGATSPNQELRRNQPRTSSKKLTLDLKPTPKKLAETLLLAEILSVPRAKRPHHPLGYKKDD